MTCLLTWTTSQYTQQLDYTAVTVEPWISKPIAWSKYAVHCWNWNPENNIIQLHSATKQVLPIMLPNTGSSQTSTSCNCLTKEQLRVRQPSRTLKLHKDFITRTTYCRTTTPKKYCLIWDSTLQSRRIVEYQWRDSQCNLSISTAAIICSTSPPRPCSISSSSNLPRNLSSCGFWICNALPTQVLLYFKSIKY